MGVENQLAGSENSSQYTGRENDGNGLYFYRARYYDPVLKRFISEDPIGLRGGLNVYSYVNGNPISITDPTGLIGEGGTGAGGFPGPSSCTYYEKRCTDSCGEDKYACEAKKCCEAFGDNKSSNCTRICLIQQDENTCSKLSGNSRDQCRKNAHYGCYAVCMNTKDAVDGWFGFKPPAACEGASGAIGGMW